MIRAAKHLLLRIRESRTPTRPDFATQSARGVRDLEEISQMPIQKQLRDRQGRLRERLAFEPGTRLHPVQIAVNVKLKEH
jgi:hypothetical protein